MNMDMHNDKTQAALIGLMRESSWTMRSIASVVILTFGSLVTLPAAAAVKQEIKQIQWHKHDATNAAKLSAKIEETHAALTRLASTDAEKLDLSASHSQLHALKVDLEALDKGAMDDFAANEAHIKADKLPDVIEKRQQEAVKTYRGNMDTLLAELTAVDAAKDSAGFMAHVSNAKAHLDKAQVKPFHAKFDPKNLPFSVAKPTGVKPRLTKKDYEARPVAPKRRAQVAANGSLAGIITAADVTGALPVSPSDPSYVAATDDVQITPAIQAQAAALHNDPVQIYNWVHNNVEYVPSYGSIQGSDMTLQTMKGNDFDQASLLIALLRASNVPARYVYGTIQVPIAQVENWVGGVTDPNAALNLLGQGGVPVTGLVQGGQIKYAQLEHVWVEAWVNFVPSRAAKPGAGNTWAPMDASFKQYTYVQGMALQQAVPFDTSAFLQHVESTTVSNAATGAVTSIDQSYIAQQLSNYQQQLSTYLTSNTSITLGQVLGSKTIDSASSPMLQASLPYQVMVVAAREAALSDSMRNKFEIELDDQNGNVLFSYTASTPDLAGKSIDLSFAPASASDTNALLSYLPDTGSATPDISQLPSSIPGYLINLIPQLYVDGTLVATGSVTTMGTTLQTQEGYWTVKDNNWSLTDRPLLSGQYENIGLDLQGLSVGELTQLQQQVQSVMQAIQSNTFTGLTSQSVIGSYLRCGILSYFALNDQDDFVGARTDNVVNYRAPSFGTMSTAVVTASVYGVPQAVSTPGVVLDVKHFENLSAAVNGNTNTQIQFTEFTGALGSGLEAIVPEQIFNLPGGTSTGISTERALDAAIAAGQTIYVVTSQNLNTVLPNLNLEGDVQAAIQDAVNAGQEVITTQSPVEISGWSGAAYVVLDPTTGAGAYTISGGFNGGTILTALGSLFTMVGAVLSTSFNALVGFLQTWGTVILDAIGEAMEWAIVGILSFIVGFAKDVATLKQACSDSEVILFGMVLICLTLAANLFLAVFTLGLFWFVIFDILMTKLDDFIVEQDVNTCKNGI